MPPIPDNHDTLEQDDRFPSGPWNGFWTQGSMKGRQGMALTFRDGALSGDGADYVGDFLCRGTYSTDSGTVSITKSYLSHVIEYTGFAEGDGIWGTWALRMGTRIVDRGGFHIWPDALGASEGQSLEAQEPQPAALG